MDPAIGLAFLGGAALAAGVGFALHLATRRREVHSRERLAHDLRTPLSSILAYTELLQDGVPETDRERFLSIIRHEAGRMDAMIGARRDATATAVAPTGQRTSPRAMQREAVVLVVDDDRFIVEATCRLLARDGFRTVGATGGAEALERARADRPDLILLDLTMPVMDGGETLRQLRAEPATRDIPVIITTGDAAAPTPAGACAVLTKPVAREMLLDAVTKALGALSGGAAR